jgi:hypothetical protein
MESGWLLCEHGIGQSHKWCKKNAAIKLDLIISDVVSLIFSNRIYKLLLGTGVLRENIIIKQHYW